MYLKYSKWRKKKMMKSRNNFGMDDGKVGFKDLKTSLKVVIVYGYVSLSWIILVLIASLIWYFFGY